MAYTQHRVGVAQRERLEFLRQGLSGEVLEESIVVSTGTSVTFGMGTGLHEVRTRLQEVETVRGQVTLGNKVIYVTCHPPGATCTLW